MEEDYYYCNGCWTEISTDEIQYDSSEDCDICPHCGSSDLEQINKEEEKEEKEEEEEEEEDS